MKTHHRSFRIVWKFLPQTIKTEVGDIIHAYFHFKGGDLLRFGDVVTAVASIAVIMILISVPFGMVLASVLGFYWANYVSMSVSILLSGLIIGYIFARKIWEARREAISKIAVLAAALNMLFAMHLPALGHWAKMIEEAYEEMYPATELSTSEWVFWEMTVLSLNLLLNAVIMFVLVFIGLYVGSMLRKQVKS